MTEAEAAADLHQSIARRKAQAQLDRDMDSALLLAQLDGAAFVLDCLGAPRSRGAQLLSIGQRIEAFQAGERGC